jgi:small-conductance mechanosensitive channel
MKDIIQNLKLLLQTDSKSSNIESVNLALKGKQDTIDNLNQQINDRNADITQLHGEISSLNAQVLSLTQAKDSLEGQAKLVPGLTGENTILKEKLTNYQDAEKSWNKSKFFTLFHIFPPPLFLVHLFYKHTKNLYINVDGIYDVTPQMVERSLKEATDKIIQYCGGTLEEFGVVTS